MRDPAGKILRVHSTGEDTVQTPPRRLFKSTLAIVIGLPFALTALSAFADSGGLIKSYEVENSVYQACKTANDLLGKGDYARARELLLKAATNDPTSYSFDVHLELARCYKSLKDDGNAVAEATSALSYRPKDERALYLLATTYNQMGQYEKALRLLDQVSKITTDEAFAGQIRKTIKEITVYRSMKQAEKNIKEANYLAAKQPLEQAAALDPSDFSAAIHGNLAFVLERTGQPERAIEEGKKALKYDPGDKATIYCIGIAYQDIGKFDDSISWLRRYASIETAADRRESASKFIEELADDRAKQDPGANSKPDYLAQLQAKDAVNMWPQEKMPLKVYISDGKNVSGFRPVFRPLIIRSLNTWCEASGKKLSYKLVDDKKAADIVVTWTKDPLPMQDGGRERQKAGLTNTILDDSTNKISFARVRIRTVNGFQPDKFITDGEAASVSMHEMGHAMGLGHSTLYSDIMYFGSSSKQTGFPTKRDRGTLLALYKSYPAVDFRSPAAVIPTDSQIKYLPPPGFLPPIPTSTEKLPPPIFMPPPAKAGQDKLTPPMFVPPPLKKSVGTGAPPMFVPPPKN